MLDARLLATEAEHATRTERVGVGLEEDLEGSDATRQHAILRATLRGILDDGVAVRAHLLAMDQSRSVVERLVGRLVRGEARRLVRVHLATAQPGAKLVVD